MLGGLLLWVSVSVLLSTVLAPFAWSAVDALWPSRPKTRASLTRGLGRTGVHVRVGIVVGTDVGGSGVAVACGAEACPHPTSIAITIANGKSLS